MKSVKKVEVAGKKVLLRGDLDVPLKNGKVADDFRIKAALPTIEYLVKKKAKLIIAAHLDRPKGRVVEKLRLDPVAEKLSEYLKTVHKLDDCVGPNVEKAVGAMAEGDVLLLENLRFHPGEEENDPEFAKELASLADIYVNDCFATSHRKHASIIGVPKLLPSYAGLRLMEESILLHSKNLLADACRTLHFSLRSKSSIQSAQKPLIFIMGGAKAETKGPLVKKLSKIADKILLGGTLMFEQSPEGIPNVIFPIDAVGIKDIGPETVKMFVEEIKEAKTIVWNGPLGIINTKEFEVGTRKIAEALAASEAYTVVGGGDTVAALKRFGLRDRIDFVSTGGGAMLQFLADGTLPGLEALGWKKH